MAFGHSSKLTAALASQNIIAGGAMMNGYNARKASAYAATQDKAPPMHMYHSNAATA